MKLFFLMLAVVSAHLCVMSPSQRGGTAGSDKPGASICAQLSSCGAAKPGAPAANWTEGQPQKLVWMKNLDHWNSAAPGNFSINIWQNGKVLGHLKPIPDDNKPSLTQYAEQVLIPTSAAKGVYTVEVVYYTNNPQAPAAFYECTDIDVVKGSTIKLAKRY